MSTRFSGGGGVVAEFFRDLKKAYAIQWGGGGVVAEIFRDLKNPMRFSGGGVVAEILRGLRKAYAIQWGGGGGVVAQNFFLRNLKTSFTLMGPFYIFLLSRRGGWAPP